MRVSDPVVPSRHVLHAGRTKLEPVSIIILSVVMALASLQLVRESVEKLVMLADDASSLPDMEIPTFVIAGSTVGKSCNLDTPGSIQLPPALVWAVSQHTDTSKNTRLRLCPNTLLSLIHI